jgi:hypothetical protein
MHDKVLFYQHDLDQGNFVYTREVLTWNAAFGVMNSFEWPRADLDPAWRDLAVNFQREVAARTAGQLLSDFTYLAPDVTLSRFGGITVVANWNPANAYMVDGYTIAPSGCLVRGADGSFVAGVLRDDTGDHYVVAEKKRVAQSSQRTQRKPRKDKKTKLSLYFFNGRERGCYRNCGCGLPHPPGTRSGAS